MTGAQFLMRVLDEKMTDQEFGDAGNAFALAYYEGKDGDSRYVDDYSQVFEVESDGFYGVADSWANYDRLAEVIGRRYAVWQAAGCPQYIV